MPGNIDSAIQLLQQSVNAPTPVPTQAAAPAYDPVANAINLLQNGAAAQTSAPAQVQVPPLPQSQGVSQDLANQGYPSPASTPSNTGNIISNSARQAIAGVPDIFLNAPTNLWNLGAAGVGTAATALGRPDLAPRLDQPPNFVTHAAEQTGFINPNIQPQTPGEQYLAAAAQGAVAGVSGGLPGMALGAASNVIGQGVNNATGSPVAGLIASLLAPAGANAAIKYGTGQVALANALKSQKQPYTDTLNEVRGAGYAVPPNLSNPNLLNATLQGIAGGRAAVGQSFSNANNAVTDAMMRQKLGLPADAPIDAAGIKSAFSTAAQPYNDMSTLAGLPPSVVGTRLSAGGLGPVENVYGPSPTPPSQLLEQWKQNNSDATDLWKKYTQGHDPADKNAYNALIAKNQGLTAQMQAAAEAAGRPEMVPALQNARVQTAQIGDIQRASNPDTGSVNALDLARARNRGVPLTGDLLTAAKMGANFPSAVQPSAKLGGGNALTSTLGTGAGAIIGNSLGGPVGSMMGAAGAPFVVNYGQGGVRSLLQSALAQRLLGTPSYSAGAVSSGLAGLPQTGAGSALLNSYLLSQALARQGQQ